MKSFRERNPRIIGAVSLVVIGLLMLVAFNVENLPVIGGGTAYRAAFRDASGLTSGNEVRIAGVKVGKVTAVELARKGATPYVRVGYRLDDEVTLGRTTKATIRIKTVLGQKYLALEPDGPGRMGKNDEIPLDRTAAPFDVVNAVTGLADTIGQIDAKQLATAFDTLSQTFADTPQHVKSSLTGLSRLSQTVASRDAELQQLLTRARGVTNVLAQRDESFRKLVSDGNLLLGEVTKRKEAIHSLLTSTSQLSTQLSGLVTDNQAQLGPALQQLRAVVTTLNRNKGNLENTLTSMAPFLRAFSNVLGNGRWFDSYIEGLLQPYLPGAPPGKPAGGPRPGSAATIPGVLAPPAKEAGR